MSRLVLVAVVLGLAAPARANVGAPSDPGTEAAEPNGLREIAIEREQLSFDLRPLDRRGSAKVAAVYHLENRGAATTVPLVFVSGAPMSSVEVTFDRSIVKGSDLSSKELADLPRSWQASLSTPGLDGEGSLPYEGDGSTAFAFTLTIPPGRHQLAVRYDATPSVDRSLGATLLYQLSYVLAPARDWGSFGTLELSVELPPDWQVAVSPALARTGDALRGRFEGLPADTIGITFRSPAGLVHDLLRVALPLLLVVVLVGGGRALYRYGRKRAGFTDKGSFWPVSMLWAFAIAVSGAAVAMSGDLAVPEAQAASHGYGSALGVLLAIFAAVIAIPVGAFFARVGSWSPPGNTR